MSISPLLYNICYNTVIEKMTKRGLKTIAFADEVTVVVGRENEAVLSTKIFNRVCAEIRLEVNTEKLGIMCLDLSIKTSLTLRKTYKVSL